MNNPYATFTCQRLEQQEVLQRLAAIDSPAQGFWRLADQEQPVWLDRQNPAIDIADSFLYECVLYVEGRLSVAVRQLDDTWEYSEAQWLTLPPEQNREEDPFVISTQLAVDPLVGYRTLRFFTSYHDAPLPVATMPGGEPEPPLAVLKPAWRAFIGFAKGEG
ncbi:MAG: hypothetical protein GX945_00170 [Lentisphaerae bacterium]|nr:hypothetical protein [Lentisphaerota bacterium]